VERGEVALGDVKAEELPEAMRGMSLGERQDYLKTRAERRAQLEEQILELNRAREEHVGKVRRGRAESGSATLDVALVESLREQARKKGLSLE